MTHKTQGRGRTSCGTARRLDPNSKDTKRPQGVAKGVSMATVWTGEESGLLSVVV